MSSDRGTKPYLKQSSGETEFQEGTMTGLQSWPAFWKYDLPMIDKEQRCD